MGDDDIDVEPDEFFSELLGAIASPVSIAELDLNVLAFGITEGETAPESICERMRRGRGYQHTNMWQFFRFLCACGERPRDCRTKNCNELPPFHSSAPSQLKRMREWYHVSALVA